MRKLYKGNIQLTYDEHKAIYKWLKNFDTMPIIEKKCEIKAENNEIFYMNYTIKGSKYGIDLKLDLTSKNNTIKKGSYYLNNYSITSKFMGIEKITLKDKKGNNIDFFINIDIIYDKLHFSNKAEFYIFKMNMLKGQMQIRDKSILENEICYRNFENELDLAFGTYCILANSCNFEENIKELYLDKLYYVEIDDMEDYYKYNLQSYDGVIDMIIDTVTDKDELLVYMLNLIYFIINKDLDKNKDYVYIADKGYKLMKKYIELYDFN